MPGGCPWRILRAVEGLVEPNGLISAPKSRSAQSKFQVTTRVIPTSSHTSGGMSRIPSSLPARERRGAMVLVIETGIKNIRTISRHVSESFELEKDLIDDDVVRVHFTISGDPSLISFVMDAPDCQGRARLIRERATATVA